MRHFRCRQRNGGRPARPRFAPRIRENLWRQMTGSRWWSPVGRRMRPWCNYEVRDQSNFALRLLASLMEEARRVAKVEGVAVNQLINVAVAQPANSLWRKSASGVERGGKHHESILEAGERQADQKQ